MAHTALAHSSERAQEREILAHKALGLLLTARRALERERLAHKASDLDKTVLATVKHALSVLTAVLVCFSSVRHFLSRNI